MRFALMAVTLLWPLASSAQEAAKPAITIDELMEKSIKAAGGREAALKVTSLAASGSIEIVAMGASASTEMLAKAPNKRLTVTVVDGYGEIKEGFDGTAGWATEPQNGLVDLTGDRLASAKREAVFNGDLNWKEIYPKSEVTGKEKVGERDCWVVKMRPADGKPATRYYDAETFLLVKAVITADTPQGPADVAVELSDYKDIGVGLKLPHTMKINMPGIGDLITRYKEYKVNPEIDDAKFAKPKG